MTAHDASAIADDTRPRRWLLIALGVVSLLLYLGIFQQSTHFELDVPGVDRPILVVLGLLAAATVLYLLAVAVVLRVSAGPGDRSLTRLVLLFAVLYRLVLLFAQPIQEIDFYRYLWDGRVLAAGHNPFRYSPQQIDALGEIQPTDSELHALWELTQTAPAVTRIFAIVRGHHGEVPTVYPPLAQLVFAGTALCVPAAAPWWLHVLALKFVLVAFDLGTLAVLVGILRRLGQPTCWCLAYAWCPLASKELANSAHLDSIAVFFTTLSAYVLLPCLQGEGGLGRACLATLCLALAILAKSYPVVLLLLFAAVLLARFRLRGLVPLGLIPLVVAAGYLPFAGKPPDPVPDDEGAFVSARPHHAGTGLRTFLTIWEMNDFLFMIVSENLRWDEREGADGQEGRPRRWFVLVPAETRQTIKQDSERLLAERGLAGSVRDPAFGLTYLLMAGVLIVVCLLGAVAVYRRPGPELFLKAIFLTLFWGWMLSATQNPWYLLWSLPFLIFAGRRAYFLMPGLVLFYYVRFWLEYQAADAAAQSQALNFFDYTLVWFEYGPFLLALIVEMLVSRPSAQAEDPALPLAQ